MRKNSYLELLSGIRVERSVVVQNVDDLQFMPLTNFVIVRVMCRGDLDSTSSELHIYHDVVADNR